MTAQSYSPAGFMTPTRGMRHGRGEQLSLQTFQDFKEQFQAEVKNAASYANVRREVAARGLTRKRP